MTITPRRNPSAVLSLLLAGTLLLGGCAVVPAETGGAGSPAPPTPTVACPQNDGAVLPPECAPYDPDHAMAQNDRYRDRMELSDEAAAAAVQPVADLRVRLEALRTEGEISIRAVEQALQEIGLPGAVVRGDEAAVELGAGAPEGGCVFGEVRQDAVRVEAGGYIMDGGCLPAQ